MAFGILARTDIELCSGQGAICVGAAGKLYEISEAGTYEQRVQRLGVFREQVEHGADEHVAAHAADEI